MTQPKILTSQADVGLGANQFVSQADLFLGSSPQGSGRIIKSLHGTLVGMTGATTIPLDNTAPLITEGTEFGSTSFTKETDDSHMHFNFTCLLDAGSNNTFVILAVFRDSTCIASSVVAIDTVGRPKNFALTGEDNPGVAGTYVYSARIGTNAGQTWYLNQMSTGQTLGGTITSTWILGEYAMYMP